MNTATNTRKRCTKATLIAIAAALALGAGGIAQAQQYAYPGSASSSGKAARTHARATATTETHDRYHAPQGRTGNRNGDQRQQPAQRGYPSKSGSPYNYANGTVHPIAAGHGGRQPALENGGAPARAPATGYPQSGYGGNDYNYAHGTVHPVRAIEPAQRPNGRHGANVSMQPGEACPIGECGHEGPAAPAGNPRGSYANGTVAPVRALPANAHPANGAHVRPVEEYGRVAPTFGQSRTGVGSHAPARTTGMGSKNFGQPGTTTIIGVDGQKTTLGGAQTITGVNGKKITAGGASSIKGINGTSYTNGVTSRPYRDSNGVNAQGDHSGGIYMNNGGMSGVATGDHSNPNFQAGQSGPNAKYDGFGHTHLPGDHGHSDDGTDSNGTEWQNGVVWDGTDENGTKWRNGRDAGGTRPTKEQSDERQATIQSNSSGGVGDDPDVGGGRDGGTLVSGTGKGINTGHRPGQDGGRGNRPDGTTDNGGSQRNNATGAYIVTNKNGQDIPVKPKVQGAMTHSYNGIKGVTDPKKTTHAGGG